MPSCVHSACKWPADAQWLMETILLIAGKSTLLKLMCGDLYPTRGDIKRHSHLVIGRYHQHSVDVLDDKMEVWLSDLCMPYPNHPQREIQGECSCMRALYWS